MKKERVVVAEIYLEEGNLGFGFTGDYNENAILYFLECYLEIAKLDYQDGFRKTDFKDRRGLE